MGLKVAENGTLCKIVRVHALIYHMFERDKRIGNCRDHNMSEAFRRGDTATADRLTISMGTIGGGVLGASSILYIPTFFPFAFFRICCAFVMLLAWHNVLLVV